MFMFRPRCSDSIGALSFALFLVCGCAHVPKEAVELSATVGRDIAIAHTAHQELARLLFGRIRDDLNRFIDNVYVPHQLEALVRRQHELSVSANPQDRQRSLFLAMGRLSSSSSAADRSAVLEGMQVLVAAIQQDIDSKRAELLTELAAQELEVLRSIDRAYQKIHHANSIVTGHLASVVRVHDAQSDVLNLVGVERDLRAEIGGRIAEVSDSITLAVDTAVETTTSLDEALNEATKLTAAIRALGEAPD